MGESGFRSDTMREGLLSPLVVGNNIAACLVTGVQSALLPHIRITFLLFRKILSHLSWVRSFERFLNLASFFFFNSLCFSSQHDYFASRRGSKINSLTRLRKKVSELYLLFTVKKINNFNSLFFLKDTGSCLIDTIHAQNTVHVVWA